MGSFTETIKGMTIRHWRDDSMLRYAPWSVASQVENNNGETLEDTVGEIKGITDSLNVTEDGYVLEATAANNLINEKMGNVVFSYEDGTYYAQHGTDVETKRALAGNGITSFKIPRISSGVLNKPVNNTTNDILSFNNFTQLDVTDFNKLVIKEIQYTSTVTNVVTVSVVDVNTNIELMTYSNSNLEKTLDIENYPVDLTNINLISFVCTSHINCNYEKYIFTISFNDITLSI